MAQWCESCGQTLPEGAVPADATWLGEPGEVHQHTFVRSDRPEKSGGEKKVLFALAAIVLLWGAFVGIGRIVTPDDAIDDQVAADLEQDRIEREVSQALAEAEAERLAAAEAEAEEAANLAETGDEPDDASQADGALLEGDALVSVAGSRTPSVQVDRLQRHLIRRSTEAFVAYRSSGGIVIIDLVSGEATVNVVAEEVTSIRQGNRVLRAGAASYSIDPDTLEVSLVGDDSSVVISNTIDGNTYFVDAKALGGQASIVEVVADGTYGFHRMPAGGFQLLPVDGLGLLAVPKGPTGETLIAGVDSFEPLRPNRVLTGTSQGVLEQLCPSENACSLVLTDLATEEQTAVPNSFVRFGDQYALAPNGRSLLRYSPEGFAEVFVSDTDSIAWVVGAGMLAPAWGPDSNFIAWLDRIGDPSLKLMFSDERDWLSIDLRDFGAPAPSGPELIVFTPAVAPSDEADGEVPAEADEPGDN